MATKLTHFAHPRGWEKGEQVNPVVRQGKPAVERDATIFEAPYTPMDMFEDAPPPDGDKDITFLVFTTAAHRDQWLKWWSKQ